MARNQQRIQELTQQIDAGRTEFVLTELETAIIFCKVALSTNAPDTRARNIENALHGYRTALRFSQTPQRDLTTDQIFQEKLRRLKHLLHELGSKV